MNTAAAGSRPLQRLFVGLFPDAAVQAAIDAHRRDWWWPRGHRLTRPARMHLTLHFLGDVDAAGAQRVREALADVHLPPLDLVLDRSCTWKNDIAVVQPAPHAGLDALHAAVVEAVRRAGLPVRDERFAPHLTIARQARGAARPPQMAPVPWRVDAFVLVASRLAPPVRYEALARCPLRPPRPQPVVM